MPPGIPPPAVKLLRKRLDQAGVEAHFAELRRDAQSLEIRIKGAAAAYSEATTAGQLDEVARRLRAGEIIAVQLRFFQDDAWWCDTLVRKGDDFRLVRMRQEDPPDQ